MRQHHPSATISTQSEFIESITSRYVMYVVIIPRGVIVSSWTEILLMITNDNKRAINDWDVSD